MSMLPSSGYGEGPLPGCRQLTSSHILTWGPFYKGTDFIHGGSTAPPSWPNYLPKALPPNPITLSGKVSTYEFWKDTSIQSITGGPRGGLSWLRVGRKLLELQGRLCPYSCMGISVGRASLTFVWKGCPVCILLRCLTVTWSHIAQSELKYLLLTSKMSVLRVFVMPRWPWLLKTQYYCFLATVYFS